MGDYRDCLSERLRVGVTSATGGPGQSPTGPRSPLHLLRACGLRWALAERAAGPGRVPRPGCVEPGSGEWELGPHPPKALLSEVWTMSL